MKNQYSEDAKRFDIFKTCEDRSREADLYEKIGDGKVWCHLCPRECVISPGQVGFCKVRRNLDGILYAQSYGKATHLTIERIETEAVFNFMPGAKILSLGNFGCNLDCDYCQNWCYSQFQYTDPKHIHEYSIQQILDMAMNDNVPILSWTYNDPAVWFEFVMDTAREAKKLGLKNLFKSAFFLSREAVEALCEVIDVFAVSIKAIDKAYYRKFTKGWLEPVLENVKLIHGRGIPIEVSNLVVTGLTNNEQNYDQMIEFVRDELGPEVPLHFTRFHPDYKYMSHPKTPLSDVEAARDRALEKGLRYSYVGNAFQSKGLNTYCPGCGVLLIERFGLHTYIQGSLAESGTCQSCGYQTRILGLNMPYEGSDLDNLK